MRRWRKVQVVDESWQYEEQTPGYQPVDSDEVAGWKPLVWLWYIGETNTPWRTRQAGVQTLSTIEDFETIEEAKRVVNKRYVQTIKV